MVQVKSVVSGHTFNTVRERLADKAELLRWDPMSRFCYSNHINFIIIGMYIINFFSRSPVSVQQECIYKETKKVKSIKK